MAGKIMDLCVHCRYLHKKLEGQKTVILPGPPFLHVVLDLFGPMVVKKMGGYTNARGVLGTFKVWGVLILCLNTMWLPGTPLPSS